MKKKVYIQPSVENTLLMMGSVVMVGSPGSTLPVSTTPIPIGGGGD